GLSLTVRAGADPGDTVERAAPEPDGRIPKAAEAVVRRTQPYRYTVYLARGNHLEEADRLLATLAAAGPSQERAWAFEHWGVVSVLRDGDVAAAEKKERAALRLDPDLVMAHDNLAGDEILLGHDESAQTHLRAEYALLKTHRADQLSPEVRPVLLAWSGARHDEGQGDFRGAASVLRATGGLTDYQGSSRAALLNRAAALALAHDVTASRALLAEVDWPRETSSFRESFEWGSSLLPEVAQDLTLENWDGMLGDLRRAQATAPFVLEPAALRSYVRPWLAWATAMSGDGAGASALIETTPTDCYLCLRVRGKLAAAARDWPGAARWFAAATRQAPSMPFAWLDWGRMLAAKGDLQGAVAMYRVAHARGPAFADPLELWGEALLRRGDLGGAIGKFAAAEAFAPRWGRLHLMWGDALAAMNRNSAAKAQWRAAAGMDLSAADRAAVAARSTR
ncbi:MAG: tetratricopeptide repeat protein, partial [Caulobacteraceae bacterium]